MELRLVSRRLLLIGTPLVVASLMIVHQLIDQFERPGAFLVLHLILLPLFGSTSRSVSKVGNSCTVTVPPLLRGRHNYAP